MNRRLLGIDHVLIGVSDLEAARRQWGRLGFNSTPRGRHVGWGTANYCIMFEHDYLELLGILDPAQFTNGLDRLLDEQGQGLLGLALASGDAAATAAAWRAAGLPAPEPQALGRLLETDGGIDLQFRNAMLDNESCGGLRLFACEHLTPEHLRRPGWLAHPNGAVRIVSCTVLAARPEALAEPLGRVFGTAALTDTDRIWAVQTGQGVILLVPPEDAFLIHPALEIDEEAEARGGPRLAVLTVAVRDLDAAKRFLELQEVPHKQVPGAGLAVAPEHACGVALELVQDR
ncbi:VOC family protein [Geminicoccaceae bacterium 1502E]|nr:VOC family protein [Geminicoccaceae bacterium 1502E]